MSEKGQSVSKMFWTVGVVGRRKSFVNLTLR